MPSSIPVPVILDLIVMALAFACAVGYYVSWGWIYAIPFAGIALVFGMDIVRNSSRRIKR